jgi:UDP-N-acetylmuramoylalanine--D-glutamate ligase
MVSHDIAERLSPENFKKKKIAVLGFGIEGIEVCRFLLLLKSSIVVYDQKKWDELDESKTDFEKKGIQFVTGENYLQNELPGFDFIFRSPGFPYLSEVLTKAKSQGSIITSAIKLFFDLCPAKIIGVTGTKGKGTTSTLIYRILKNSHKDVYLAGNIGTPPLGLFLNQNTLDFSPGMNGLSGEERHDTPDFSPGRVSLPRLNRKSWIVLELSSFQLQDITVSPHLSVVLFISSAHQNVHKSFEEYYQAKSNIIRYQKSTDLAVFNFDDHNASALARFTKAKKYYFSRYKKTNSAYVNSRQLYYAGRLIGPTGKLKLRGEHNWDNICAAISAAKAIDIPLDIIRKTIYAFKGLEHRLELVRKVNGVAFYDDSFSTEPETAIAAIKSFTEPLILIAGGSDKGSDYSELGNVIAHSTVKTLIVIGDMAVRIKSAAVAHGFTGKIVRHLHSMKAIVDSSRKASSPGNVVILSPACASFDMFQNYKDRGNQFKQHVKTIPSA